MRTGARAATPGVSREGAAVRRLVMAEQREVGLRIAVERLAICSPPICRRATSTTTSRALFFVSRLMILLGALTAGPLPAEAQQPAAAPASPSRAPRASGAKPPAVAESPAPASSPGAPSRTSASAYVATEIVRGLGEVPRGALVVAAPLVTDTTAPKADALTARIAGLVAGRLGAQAHAQPVGLSVARGLSGRAASLVFVQLEIAKGELRATADLYPAVANGWERLRNPLPGPRAHAFASAPLDAEVRTFLAPVVLEQALLHKAKHDEGDVLAIGCGDIDADGGMELVLVSRARVALGRVRAGKFVPQRTAPWSALASRAPVPMREPLASVLVSPRARNGEILLGTTDRGGVALDGALVTRRQLTGLPVVGSDGEACAAPLPEASAYDGDVVACTAPANGAPATVLVPPQPRFDAIATLDLVDRDGRVEPIVAAREPSGKLRIRWGEPGAAKAAELTVDATGAQIALADLDLDGAPELITTELGDTDALVISSVTAKGAVVPRLRFPAKEGVRAVGVCPPEERGAPAVVAVVGGEVWLVR